MSEFLGETPVNLSKTKFADYTPADWAKYWIEVDGSIDCAHHKQWVIDQVMQILNGTPVVAKLARWDNGKEELRLSLGEPSREYKDWLDEYNANDNYSDWDQGIAP